MSQSLSQALEFLKLKSFTDTQSQFSRKLAQANLTKKKNENFALKAVFVSRVAPSIFWPVTKAIESLGKKTTSKDKRAERMGNGTLFVCVCRSQFLPFSLSLYLLLPLFLSLSLSL